MKKKRKEKVLNPEYGFFKKLLDVNKWTKDGWLLFGILATSGVLGGLGIIFDLEPEHLFFILMGAYVAVGFGLALKHPTDRWKKRDEK